MPRFVAARLGAAYFFLFVPVGIWTPFVAPWLASLGHDATTIGVLLALVTGTKLVAPTAWAWVGDVTGRRARLVKFGAFMTFACGLALAAGARSALALAFVLGAYGVFWNAAPPQLEALTLKHLGAAPQRYALTRLWGSVGFLLTVVAMGAWFEHAGLAWFAIALAVALAANWLAMLPVPDAPEEPAAATSLRGALAAPGVAWLFAAMILMQLGFGAYYGFFSLRLAGLGWDETAIGLYWALGVVAEIAAFAFMPGLMVSVSAVGLLQAACALTALRWLLLALLADRMPVLVLAQVLHLASFAVYHAVAVQLTLRAFPGRLAGRGQALHSSLAYGAGGAAGVAASGALWDRLGPASPFLFAAVAALAAWACAARLGRLRPAWSA